MTTKLAGQRTRFLPFNLGTTAARATRRTRPGTAPRTCGSRSGSATPGSICSAASSTSRCPARGRRSQRRRAGAVDLPALPPVGRGAASSRPTPASAGPGQNYLVQHSAGSGKSQHDRLARAPALDAARRDRREGVRQGRRDHRPGGARPAAAGDDLPVRARHGVVEKIDKDSQPARGGARGRAGADHHHDAPEVPVRPRQGRRAPGSAATR